MRLDLVPRRSERDEIITMGVIGAGTLAILFAAALAFNNLSKEAQKNRRFSNPMLGFCYIYSASFFFVWLGNLARRNCNEISLGVLFLD
jgi:hypothetical protein